MGAISAGMLLCSIPAVIAGCSMQPAFIRDCTDDPSASGALVRNADDVRSRGLIAAAARWACVASATASLSQCAQLSTYVAGETTSKAAKQLRRQPVRYMRRHVGDGQSRLCGDPRRAGAGYRGPAQAAADDDSPLLAL